MPSSTPPLETSYRVVHISDLHLWRIPANPLLWRGKRLLGLSNLVLRRGRRFRREALPELLAEIERDSADHLVVSGDLTTTSLDLEFEDFGKAFDSWLGDPYRATLVPGNHDRYTRPAVRERVFERHFSPLCGEGNFPFRKELAPGLALIGFDPCRPNPFSARGEAPGEALVSLTRLLGEERSRGTQALLFVCHYPAEAPAKHRRHLKGHDLVNGEELLALFQGFPIPTWWLHGHIHHPWSHRSRLAPNLTYLNPGSPILRREGKISLGRWVLDWDGRELRAEWRSLPHSASELESEG